MHSLRFMRFITTSCFHTMWNEVFITAVLLAFIYTMVSFYVIGIPKAFMHLTMAFAYRFLRMCWMMYVDCTNLVIRLSYLIIRTQHKRTMAQLEIMTSKTRIHLDTYTKYLGYFEECAVGIELHPDLTATCNYHKDVLAAQHRFLVTLCQEESLPHNDRSFAAAIDAITLMSAAMYECKTALHFILSHPASVRFRVLAK